MTCSLILVYGSYCLQYLHLNILWCMNRWWHWAVSSFKFFTAWIQCVQIKFSQSLHTFATLVAPKRSALTIVFLLFIPVSPYPISPISISTRTPSFQIWTYEFKFKLIFTSHTISISIYTTLIFKSLFRRLPYFSLCLEHKNPKPY